VLEFHSFPFGLSLAASVFVGLFETGTVVGVDEMTLGSVLHPFGLASLPFPGVGFVGAQVGDEVGVSVGTVVGISVGISEGTVVGTSVGVTVGVSVRTVVGDSVGVKVARELAPAIIRPPGAQLGQPR